MENKTSVGKILEGFECEFDSTIFIKKGVGYQGKGVSRTMFLNPDLNVLPPELFAVKLSQSTNPARAGRVVFRYLSFRFSPDAKFENLAPDGTTLQTPLNELRNLVVGKLSAIPNVQTSININLHGRFTNVTCADGVYAIYDEEKFPNPDPNKAGDAPYYIKSDTVLHVKLKGAVSQGNEYFQTVLSTTQVSDEIFQKSMPGKVWGEDTGTAQAPVIPPAATDAAAQTGAPAVW